MTEQLGLLLDAGAPTEMATGLVPGETVLVHHANGLRIRFAAAERVRGEYWWRGTVIDPGASAFEVGAPFADKVGRWGRA